MFLSAGSFQQASGTCYTSLLLGVTSATDLTHLVNNCHMLMLRCARGALSCSSIDGDKLFNQVDLAWIQRALSLGVTYATDLTHLVNNYHLSNLGSPKMWNTCKAGHGFKELLLCLILIHNIFTFQRFYTTSSLSLCYWYAAVHVAWFLRAKLLSRESVAEFPHLSFLIVAVELHWRKLRSEELHTTCCTINCSHYHHGGVCSSDAGDGRCCKGIVDLENVQTRKYQW